MLGIYGDIGILEKKMETTILGYIGITVDEFRDSSLKKVMICAYCRGVDKYEHHLLSFPGSYPYEAPALVQFAFNCPCSFLVHWG